MENLVMTKENFISTNFWQGKRILVTGHSGFKGAWLAHWLNRLGADVIGISLPPITTPNLFSLIGVKNGYKSYFCNINDINEMTKLVKNIQPEIIFHLAAQPLVRAGYRDPITTFQTNVMGVVNILNILREVESARAAIMVTTDKVYRNTGTYWGYRENDMLGGYDPYSASKAASEIIISSYREAFLSERGIAIASVRAGNIIGGGDWSEDRLIPDAVRAWQNNQPLIIRNQHSIRPWQHVLEPLAGYLLLAQKIYDHPELAEAYNFGPESNQIATVGELVSIASRVYGSGVINYEINDKGQYEAALLTLDISKAKIMLGIRPKWTLYEAINRTINWYLDQYRGVNAKLLCDADIDAYEASV
jgi:CDP-glucose 4,6-dehydratase